MKLVLKSILFGTLLWLLPFLLSFLVYKPLCQLDIMLFKSVMIVFGSFCGLIFLYLIFRGISENFIKWSLLIGFIWFFINILLDLIFLLPMSQINTVLYGVFQEYQMTAYALKESSFPPIINYFLQIGIRYLSMPIFAFGIAWVLQKKIDSFKN